MNDMPVFDLNALNVSVEGKKPSFLTSANGYRAKVPGGWLVFICGNAGLNGTTFYPDPDHKWNGGTEE